MSAEGRPNIVVIADEAHCSQYDFIDVSDILQSKEDNATVPIYYEASAPARGAVNRALAVHRSA